MFARRDRQLTPIAATSSTNVAADVTGDMMTVPGNAGGRCTVRL
jgi:hypothetical protein